MISGIVVAVLAIFGYIFGLHRQNATLSNKVGQLEAKEELMGALDALSTAGKEADAKEDNYKRALDEYNKSKNGS